jgi:hypothetical protein
MRSHTMGVQFGSFDNAPVNIGFANYDSFIYSGSDQHNLGRAIRVLALSSINKALAEGYHNSRSVLWLKFIRDSTMAKAVLLTSVPVNIILDSILSVMADYTYVQPYGLCLW